MREIQVLDKHFELLLSREVIASRVAELAADLKRKLQGETPLFVAVLNGASLFAADLLRSFDGDCELSFVRYASYEGMSSTGTVKELIGLKEEVEGRTLVLVEDIVETGHTISLLKKHLEMKKAAKVMVCSLLHKPTEQVVDAQPDMIGFELDKEFVVGYGLDYKGLGRNYADIYKLKKS